MLHKRINLFLWTLLLLALAGLFATVSAIDTRWTGVNSSVWSDVSNWDNGIPDVGDRAIFDGNYVITSSISSISSTPHDILIQNGATITLQDNLSISGSLTISSGSLSVGSFSFSADGDISGAGSLYVVDGMVSVGQTLSIQTLQVSSTARITLHGNWSVPDMGFSGAQASIYFSGATD